MLFMELSFLVRQVIRNLLFCGDPRLSAGSRIEPYSQRELFHLQTVRRNQGSERLRGTSRVTQQVDL